MEINTLPIVRYKLVFQVTRPFELPEYAGSTLRGAFGKALRYISCMTKQDNCKICPLYKTCPYTTVFETPVPDADKSMIQQFSQVPNSYIIEPPQWGRKKYLVGELLEFNLVLFGRTIHHNALIIFAFQRALSYNIASGQANLLDVKVYEKENLKSILKNNQMIEHSQVLEYSQPNSKNVKLILKTPLRLQENGKPLNENNITYSRFFLSLAKRISLLNEFHHNPIDLDFNALKLDLMNIREEKDLYWQDWTRYSSRQQQKMKLGGVMGEWIFYDVSLEWLNLLYFGQWLHNGKNATFGLGQYTITSI